VQVVSEWSQNTNEVLVIGLHMVEKIEYRVWSWNIFETSNEVREPWSFIIFLITLFQTDFRLQISLSLRNTTLILRSQKVSNLIKFAQKLLTVIPPNRFSIMIYYIISLLIFIFYFNNQLIELFWSNLKIDWFLSFFKRKLIDFRKLELYYLFPFY
jgi:hypothetical protein